MQTLSADQDAHSPQIAVDGSDRATITWTATPNFRPASARIHSVRLAADGTPGPVQALSAAGLGGSQNAVLPQVAVDGSGRATIAWRFDTDPGVPDAFRIQAVRLAADGTPGPVRTLSAASYDVSGPQVAVDGSGRATITWRRDDGADDRIQAVRLAADGTPGPVRTLSAAGQNARNQQIAVDGSDRATITWQRFDGSNFRVEAVRLAADGTPGPVRTLSAADRRADDPQVAVDGSDRATIIWASRFDGPASARIQAVRLAANGTPGPVQTVSDADQDALGASDPQIAVDGSERATITWVGFEEGYLDPWPDPLPVPFIRAVRLAADGTPGAVQTLAGGDLEQGVLRDVLRDPQVAVDGSGRATIAWQLDVNGNDDRIQAARLAADGTPGAVQTLSAAGQGSGARARDQQIAVDNSDRATITWSRYDGTDTDDQIQAVRSFDDTSVNGSAKAKKTQKQKGKRIVVEAKVKAKEDLEAKGTGKVKVRKKGYKLKRVDKSVGEGTSKTLKLKPTNTGNKKIREALKNGKKATAKLEVKLSDEAGNKETTKLKVKLRRTAS